VAENRDAPLVTAHDAENNKRPTDLHQAVRDIRAAAATVARLMATYKPMGKQAKEVH